MKQDRRKERHEQICRAAYELLATHGYGGTSMLYIARAAKASNETLYRWYGDKDGLFRSMVEDNAAETRQMLSDSILAQTDPRQTLATVAPVFLNMLLGDRAILLNRAAAADPTGALGAAISAGGRNEVMPLFEGVMERLCQGKAVTAKQATHWFLGLLIGDLQIRRVINDAPALSEAQALLRSREALDVFYRLIDGAPPSAG
jgi:AcrR family transcriptional regulator